MDDQINLGQLGHVTINPLLTHDFFPNLTVQVHIGTINQQTGLITDVSGENNVIPAPLSVMDTPRAVRNFQVQHLSATYARYGLSVQNVLAAQAYVWDMEAQALVGTPIGRSNEEWIAVVRSVSRRYHYLAAVKRSNPAVGAVLRPKVYILFGESYFQACLASRNVDPSLPLELLPVYNHEHAVKLWRAGTPGRYGKAYQEYMFLFGVPQSGGPGVQNAAHIPSGSNLIEHPISIAPSSTTTQSETRNPWAPLRPGELDNIGRHAQQAESWSSPSQLVPLNTHSSPLAHGDYQHRTLVGQDNLSPRPSQHRRVPTAEDYARGGLEPQGPTKNAGDKCLTCIKQGYACKGDAVDQHLGRARCATCRKYSSRRCYWRDPALGIATYDDAKAHNLYHRRDAIFNQRNTSEGVARRKAEKQQQETDDYFEALEDETLAQQRAARQRQEDEEVAWLRGEHSQRVTGQEDDDGYNAGQQSEEEDCEADFDE